MKNIRAYLEEAYRAIREQEGSLAKVARVRGVPHAKEYLSKLAAEGTIERAAWGWYYAPPPRPPSSVFEFLARDTNFKVVAGQTAASFWNGDFVHRETVVLTVDDPSYKRALEAFAEKRGWRVSVDHDEDAQEIPRRRIGGLWVEDRVSAIVHCMQRWAFLDAVATLSKPSVEHVRKRAYWARVSGTSVRVGQAVEYAAHRMYGLGREVAIAEASVREELDEAVEKVMELA